MASLGAPGLPPAAQASQPEGSSSSSQRQEPVIRLHGYDILMDVGMRPHTHVYKVRPKLHDDVPVYMDDEEPCYALKCIDMNEPDLPAEGKQRAVREAQALLKLQHPNVARYHKAFLSEGRLCYMTEYAEQTLHHLIYTMKERQQRLSEDLTWHLFVQICQGLKKLHDSAIIHRALKARNLLLFAEPLFVDPVFKYRCKLTDLGIPELQRHLRHSTSLKVEVPQLGSPACSDGPARCRVALRAREDRSSRSDCHEVARGAVLCCRRQHSPRPDASHLTLTFLT